MSGSEEVGQGGSAGGGGAFTRLHPALQYHVVNSLGWRSLRPLQEESIPPILAGEHALITAPTAGGKTEAAVLPLLSRALAEGWKPLALLYVCPLRALLNDLEGRLSHLCGLLGRRAALWHGDVGPAARRRVQREPPDLLLTTPESIEVMLTSRSVDAVTLFAHLRAVVVDELHAFAGDDRGWHLLAVLERVARLAGRDLQRVGLSATVGNPPELAAWLAGSSPAPRRVVAPVVGGAAEPEVRIDYVGGTENAAELLSRLHLGEKRLVFCESRAQAEELAYALRQRAVETHVSHSSLGLDERRRAEAAFREGRDCVIVATSTLELGIDVGDLDRVVQVGAPGRVASFLQRLGRSGRREGTRSNLLFLATTEESLLLACALTRLWRQGFVEPLVPPPAPFHILAQQVLALVLQPRGLVRPAWREWVGGMPGFAALAATDVEAVIGHMLAEGLLFSDGGILGLGPEGERRFRGKRLLDLMSAFSTAPLFRVFHGPTVIGQVDEASLLSVEDGATVLLLGGRSWWVAAVEWSARVIHVEPIEREGHSIWPGGRQPLSFRLCRALREVATGAEPGARLTARANGRLEVVRAAHDWLTPEGSVLDREGTRRWCWWTFAGLKANATLAEHLKRRGLTVLGRNNLSVALAGEAVAPALAAAVGEMAASGEPIEAALPGEEAVASLKFSFCVPPPLARETIRRRWSDPEAVAAVLKEPLRLTYAATLKDVGC